MIFNETSSTPSKNKRSLKAQTKKQSKKSDSKQEGTIALNKMPSISLPYNLVSNESSSGIEYQNDFSMSKCDKNLTDLELEKLTNKKKEYLQDAIIDKNGAYSYLDDPLEYKKARKRL